MKQSGDNSTAVLNPTIALNSSTAILLLAHGTPNCLSEMSEYLARVTGGRTLSRQVVEELQHRYALIGLGHLPGPGATPQPGSPPLTRWTLAQARLLADALATARHPLRVYAAMRNWHPFIADVVGQMRADGVTRLLAVCLAPQNSSTSTGLYRRALLAALEAGQSGYAAHDASPVALEIALTFIEEWSEEPALIAAFAQRLVDLYPRACAERGVDALPILFTAHSVPCRTIQSSELNPTAGLYPVQAKHTAKLVFDAASRLLASTGRRLPTLQTWFFAFQSQGVAGGPWIGPTVEETLAAIRAEGYPAVVLQPVGFLCDHVEILYDIDIAFAATARRLGLGLYRAESLNDSPLLTQALRNVVIQHLAPHNSPRASVFIEPPAGPSHNAVPSP